MSAIMEQDSQIDRPVKYVVVTGGVISGVGKGIIASSMGVLLRSLSQRVTAIKIDPYINIDAGTLSPLDHGEVFVLDDGGEVDLDLGNYERFLDVTLGRDNNITLGKVYQHVVEKERRGDYLGKTVQVVPHVTDAIQDWIERVAHTPVQVGHSSADDDAALESNANRPDVCIVELGGTIGDIEGTAFVEALRQFQFRVGRENFFLVHVCLVPTMGDPNAGGEQKSKPVQMSVRDLRAVGLVPDVIACRSATPLTDSVRSKIAMFCHVPMENIMSVHDCRSVYHVPMLLASQGLDSVLASRLQLTANVTLERVGLTHPLQLEDNAYFAKWTAHAHNLAEPNTILNVALVGKYTHLHDSYMSIIKALNHAGMQEKIDVKILWIEASDLETPNDADNLNEEAMRPKSPSHNPLLYASHANGQEIVAHMSSDSVGSVSSINNHQQQQQSTASLLERHQQAWTMLKSAHAVIVPGGFGTRGTEGKIAAIEYARINNIPFLGICLGFQMAVAEHARHILGMSDANSVEFNKETTHPVVVNMPEISATKLGGTMRLGARPTRFVQDRSYVRDIYSVCNGVDRIEIISERHRHRYEVNPEMILQLEQQGLVFVAKDADTGMRMEILERSDHPYFTAAQFHPEYLSRPLRPAPLFVGLLKAASSSLL